MTLYSCFFFVPERFLRFQLPLQRVGLAGLKLKVHICTEGHIKIIPDVCCAKLLGTPTHENQVFKLHARHVHVWFCLSCNENSLWIFWSVHVWGGKDRALWYTIEMFSLSYGVKCWPAWILVNFCFFIFCFVINWGTAPLSWFYLFRILLYKLNCIDFPYCN